MTTLEFGEEKLFFIIHSKKFDCEIDRTLEYLDLELEDIPLEMLRNIKYNFAYSNVWANRITDVFELEEFEHMFNSISNFIEKGIGNSQ